MARRKSVKTTRESKSGRNTQFKGSTGKMNRKDFVKRIEKGYYPGYHVRNINGTKTPVSNPDKSKGNNLD